MTAKTSVAASAVMVERGNSPQPDDTVVCAVFPQNASPTALLTTMARMAIISGKATTRKVQPAQSTRAVIVTATPLEFDDAGQTRRAMAMVVPGKGNAVSDADPAVGTNPVKPAPVATAQAASDDPLADQNRAHSALRLLGLINTQARFQGATLSFVNELARQTGATRVSLGFVRDSAVRVAALSGATHINAKSAMIRDLGLAMNEAVDQASTIVYPRSPGDGARVTLAHGRFTVRHSSPTLCTIPMTVNHEGERSIVGAVGLEFGNARKLDGRAIRFVEHATALVGPTLEAYRQLEHPVGSRLAQSLGGSRRRLTGARSYRNAVALILGALLIGAGLIPAPSRVTANARLEGAMQRVLAAPVQGYIGTVHVRPGERVKAGQPLVELDDRELALEARKWRSEEAQIQKRYGEALATEAQGDIAIERARLAQARAQMNNIEDQLERMRLRAPFDGVVLSGDLSQSLGAPVTRGETLMTIAPADAYRIIAEVDERDIARIQPGQTGQLVIPAVRDGTLSLNVERVTPVAVIRKNINVFEVQASLVSEAGEDQPAGIRPGLEGVVKIQTGRRPLLATMTERLRDWMRITLWKWRA